MRTGPLEVSDRGNSSPRVAAGRFRYGRVGFQPPILRRNDFPTLWILLLVRQFEALSDRKQE